MTPDFTPGAILRETAGHLRERLGETLYEGLTLERAVFGLFFTGVKLSDGAGGISFTPVKAIPEAVCCPSSARAMPLSGRLRGTPVSRIVEESHGGTPLKKALGIAVLNALSTSLEAREGFRGYRVVPGPDALDSVELVDGENVVIVGALAPFMKRLKGERKPFTVLEMDPRTLKADEMPFYAPAEEAPRRIPGADLVVVTGTTLVNDTLEGLLSLVRPGARVVLVGPTASQYPEAFFRRGVSLLGGIRVTGADDLLDLLAEAGSGYHFFGKCADRVTLTREREGEKK